MTHFLRSNVYLRVLNLNFSDKPKECAVCEMNMVAKKTKTRKRGKGKWKRNLGILLSVIAFIVIITFSVLQQIHPQPPPVPKKPANEYFSFSGGFASAEAVGSPPHENETIRINQVGFNITAVGGNVTNLYIYPREGMVAEEDSIRIDNMTQGESEELGPVQYQSSVVVQKEANGYPLHFRIASNEAEGEVTIYVTIFA